MVISSFSTLKDRQRQLSTQTSLLELKKQFTAQDTEILKLAVMQSNKLIIDLIDAVEQQHNKIEELEKICGDHIEAESNHKALLKELSTSFEELAKTCEIASIRYTGERTP